MPVAVNETVRSVNPLSVHVHVRVGLRLPLAPGDQVYKGGGSEAEGSPNLLPETRVAASQKHYLGAQEMQHNHPAVAGEEIITLMTNNPCSEPEERCNSSGTGEVYADNQNTLSCQGDINCCLRLIHWLRKLKKKDVIIILGLLFLISVVIGIYLADVTKSSPDPCPTTAVLSCPSEWVGYEGRCYYFSLAEGTWNESKSNCSAYGASLVPVENPEEMRFIMRYGERTDYWIGLKRKERQPWKWANGSIFNNWFEIGADGPCAYWNGEKASSTWCDTRRNWICSKSAHKP